jgi:hypothetical protein
MPMAFGVMSREGGADGWGQLGAGSPDLVGQRNPPWGLRCCVSAEGPGGGPVFRLGLKRACD